MPPIDVVTMDGRNIISCLIHYSVNSYLFSTCNFYFPRIYTITMCSKAKTVLPSIIAWIFFIALTIYLVTIIDANRTEIFLMLLIAVFSAVITTEGLHELLDNRPLGTLKEFSYMTREKLSLYRGRRISVFNGALHVITGFMVSISLIIRAFYSTDFILIPFFRSLIPIAILLALGSYWVNYGNFFKTEEGRAAGRLRNGGAALRTAFSLLVAIGASYGLSQFFTLL